MARIVSFEGCMGVGKTTLVNFLAEDLGVAKMLEHSQKNPFIEAFYAGADVKLETELTFLLQHYSMLKQVIHDDRLILADFSIEKDLVFARMNLGDKEFHVFKGVYDFVLARVGLPDLVIYLDLPAQTFLERISRRGRTYELKTSKDYFMNYSRRLSEYFADESQSKVLLIDGTDIELVPSHPTVGQIRDAIQKFW